MDPVEEINISTLIQWANKTAKADRYSYKAKQRNLTLHRCISNISPNLKSPIFLLGSPRSGTTFLGDCITQLSEISYHFEPVATKAAARYVYEKRWSYGQAAYFYRAVYAWLMRLHWDGDLRFSEKTPRNCFIISFLAQVFPGAKFVHIIRDGRDAALSHSLKPWLQANQHKSAIYEPGGYPFGAYPRFWVESERRDEFAQTSDIHRCIWAWRRHVESAMKTLSKLPEESYHELRYESLVVNPEREGKALLSFLNVSNPQSQQKLFDKLSFAKATSIGNWRGALNQYQLAQVDQEAGLLLEKLGY
jgi:hypothetical protein